MLRQPTVRILAICGLLSFAGILFAQGNGKRVLFVPRGARASDYMIEKEAFVIINGMKDAGFTVEVATLSGTDIEGTKLKVNADLKISDVDVSKYDAIVLACMAQGPIGSWHSSEDERNLVRAAASKGILIAAQSSSIITLAEAGLLDGKKYGYYKNKSTYSALQKAEYAGVGVFRDGQIITSSSCPQVPVEINAKMKDLTVDYVQAITQALNQ
jgi:putative intracellular protease/amidase